MADDDEFLQAPRRPDEDRSSLITWVLSHTGVRMPESNDKVRAPRNPSAQHPIPAGKNKIRGERHARASRRCMSNASARPCVESESACVFQLLESTATSSRWFQISTCTSNNNAWDRPGKNISCAVCDESIYRGGCAVVRKKRGGGYVPCYIPCCQP